MGPGLGDSGCHLCLQQGVAEGVQGLMRAEPKLRQALACAGQGDEI